MRQDVFREIEAPYVRLCAGIVIAIACMVQTGCQMTSPMALPQYPLAMQAQNNRTSSAASLKPQVQDSVTQQAAPTGVASSGDGASSAGSTSSTGVFGSGLATGSAARIRGQSPNGMPGGTNRYAPRNSSPTSLPAQPVAAQTGLGGTPLGQVPNTIVNQPQLPAGGAYTSPGTGYAAPNGYGGGGYSTTQPGYGTGTYGNGAYGSALAPGAVGAPYGPSAIAPGATYTDPNIGITAPSNTVYRPRERIAPIDVYIQEARTGRIILGGSVNSDLGVAGQLIIDERNFNIRRFPKSWGDLWSGRAFRGGGQNFRAELMPGDRVERYTVSWTERNLLGYLPYSLSVGGFLYTRQFRDWTEQRLGGRVALGYEVTKDIAVSSEIRMEDVKLFDPRIAGVQELDDALGSNDIYTARFRLSKDTRDSPFMATRGSMLELIFDQVFGEYDYSRGAVNYSKYFRVRERADGTGRHVLASTWRVGITGSQTPIFENYFAGGYSTLRGFSFRGASPTVGDVQVGGEFMFLGSLEYVFPLTADEMLRGVAFVDYGTIEPDLDINSEDFRVAPGLGLRVTVPALGPAPLAFDFAYPINHADSDDRQIFSFFMGFTR